MKNTQIFCWLFIIAFHNYSFSQIKESHKPAISSQPVKKKDTSKLQRKTFSHFNPYKMGSFFRLIQIGNYKAVLNLIEKGADINKKSIKLTPLMYAARHNRVDIVLLLIEKGANLKTRTSEGYTALKWAKLSNASESYNVIYNALKKNRK